MANSVVWFKKDLRVQDHQPLRVASEVSHKVVGLYIYEPQWFQSYEFDSSHLEFLNHSLQELQHNLAEHNIPLILRHGEALDVFKQLRREFLFDRMFAHQETGVDWSFRRDIKVAQFCKDQGVEFQEFAQFGVIRGLKSRDAWAAGRSRLLERPLYPPPRKVPALPPPLPSVGLLSPDDVGIRARNFKKIQKGGAQEAERRLAEFLDGPSGQYLKSISSPQLAKDYGSRLSPYLSFGNLSISQVLSQINKVPSNRNISAFKSRLWWHCHFIQKLETKPEIECQNMNRAFDGLREAEFNERYFEAWKKGETGFPMVDASMRCLLQTGWVNFRMRAMLISFASYQMWLHWVKPAQFLAKHFLDFEPGIHFSQIQMQAGVTGINTIRIYSPIKQALDQEGAVDFIRTYCPELAALPDQFVLEPYKLPPLLAIDLGFRPGVDYPDPVLDHQQRYKLAKARIFEWKKRQSVKGESKLVYQKLGSRRRKAS